MKGFKVVTGNGENEGKKVISMESGKFCECNCIIVFDL